MLIQGGKNMQPLNPEHKAFLREYFRKKNLSRSEVEVVILVLQGLINREVANQLCVAEKTIKFHLGNAYKKLNISRRSQLIWTLPLADFVGVANKDYSNNNNLRSNETKTSNNDLIPSGISTVDDMARENKNQGIDPNPDLTTRENKNQGIDPDPDLTTRENEKNDPDPDLTT